MRRRQIIATLAAVVYAGIMLGHTVSFLWEPAAGGVVPDPPPGAIGTAVFVLVTHVTGMALLGGGAIYLLLRFGLVSPVALVSLFTVRSLGEYFVGGGFTELYVTLWGLFVGPVVVAAVLEYGVREWLVFYPPEPIL